MISIFIWIYYDILMESFKHLDIAFFIESPENAGRAGGIKPILMSTLLILAICLAVSFPLALGTAVVLSGQFIPLGSFGRVIHQAVLVLAGVPSVVFGLFGNVLFCQYLGFGYSILSGGLTLACMILPLSIKLLEDSLRSVPSETLLSSKALGLSYYSTIFRIILPSITPQLTAAFILSIGRAMAETAALLFTSGYVMREPSSIFDSGRTLSIHIFDLSMNVSGGDRNAYLTAFTLLIGLLLVNLIGHGINRTWRYFQYGH